MKILRRLWIGVVAALAGVALAIVMQIIGQMTLGLAMHYLGWVALGCGVSGFLVGVALGPGGAKAATKR